MTTHLRGNLQTGTSVSSTSTDPDTYAGTTTVDTSRARFSGQIDSGNPSQPVSSFSGTFFGGTEIGATLEILASDMGGDKRRGDRHAGSRPTTAAR